MKIYNHVNKFPVESIKIAPGWRKIITEGYIDEYNGSYSVEDWRNLIKKMKVRKQPQVGTEHKYMKLYVGGRTYNILKNRSLVQ